MAGKLFLKAGGESVNEKRKNADGTFFLFFNASREERP